jgi:hypothetical protein
MNKILLHQIVRVLNTTPNSKDQFHDISQSEAVLALFAEKIQELLTECDYASHNDGICNINFTHKDCAAYMRILYMITDDSKYLRGY